MPSTLSISVRIPLKLNNNFLPASAKKIILKMGPGLAYLQKILLQELTIKRLNQRILTSGEVSLYVWPTINFVWIQLLCLCWINNNFTCLVNSKPVKQEVSCTEILPSMASVLWLNLCVDSNSFINTYLVSELFQMQPVMLSNFPA